MHFTNDCKRQVVFAHTFVLTFSRLWAQSFCSGKLYKEEPGRVPTEQGEYHLHSSQSTFAVLQGAHSIATDFSGDTLIHSTHTHTHAFLRLCTDRISLMRFWGVNDVMLGQAPAAAIFSWFGCFWSDLWWFVCTEGSWDIPVLLFSLLLCDSDGLNCA